MLHISATTEFCLRSKEESLYLPASISDPFSRGEYGSRTGRNPSSSLSFASFLPQNLRGRSSLFLRDAANVDQRTSPLVLGKLQRGRPHARACERPGYRKGRVRSLLGEAGSENSLSVKNVSVILLAGGSGSRMKADMPKQFLELAGKTVVEHSLELFWGLREVTQIVLVVAEEYRGRFKEWLRDNEDNPDGGRLCFADPGKERQDSVYSGFEKVAEAASLVCIHDAARPLISPQVIVEVMKDAWLHGAAVLGVPSKATIKESADGKFVLRTIERSRLWEIQTPQVIRPDLLRKGFAKIRAENLAVTDDVSIVEHLGEPVRITMGEYSNIKLTTPEDMSVASSILEARKRSSAYSAKATSARTR